MEKAELTLRVEDEQEIFKLYDPPKQPSDFEEYKCIDEDVVQSFQRKNLKLMEFFIEIKTESLRFGEQK